MTDNPWIRCPKPRPDARVRLFCIPHAGGGAATFRLWQDQLPGDVEVRAIQLPGRENRLLEKPFTEVETIVEELSLLIRPDLDRTYAVFGHSMGALIAFELIRQLRLHGAELPEVLLASGYRAPQVRLPGAPIHLLPNSEFLEEVQRRYDAVPREALENAELMELLLPTLRADIAVCDSYVYRDDDPLPLPIVALGGEHDGQVGVRDLEAWKEQTSGSFGVQQFPGDHFYLQTAQEALLARVSAELAKAGG